MVVRYYLSLILLSLAGLTAACRSPCGGVPGSCMVIELDSAEDIDVLELKLRVKDPVDGTERGLCSQRPVRCYASGAATKSACCSHRASSRRRFPRRASRVSASSTTTLPSTGPAELHSRSVPRSKFPPASQA